MKKQIVAAGFALFAAPALAGEYCLLDDGEMFTCTFQGGAKAVEVCDAFWLDDTAVSYAFFKRNGEIEKEIVTEKALLIATPFNGMGSVITEAVRFNAGEGYAYEVFYSSERSADAVEEGGINVLKDEEVIATLSCDAGSVTHRLGELVEMVETAQISP